MDNAANTAANQFVHPGRFVHNTSWQNLSRFAGLSKQIEELDKKIQADERKLQTSKTRLARMKIDSERLAQNIVRRGEVLLVCADEYDAAEELIDQHQFEGKIFVADTAAGEENGEKLRKRCIDFVYIR